MEKYYIGKLNPRSGQRRAPVFPTTTWSIYERELNDVATTNNSVESWNSNWSKVVGTNHNALRIISRFMEEDALARTNFQKVVAGQYVDPNPGRTARFKARMESLKIALLHYNRANIKEFLYGQRDVDI